MSDIKFIPANGDDLTLLKNMAADIWNVCYADIISQQQISYMLNMMYNEEVIEQELNKGIVWEIILVNEQKAGFLSYSFNESDKKIKLFKLYVYTSFQGKAIGQAALQHVVQKAKQLNAKQVYLTVNKRNEKAIKAYLRSGFSIDKDIVADIGNGYVMDDYIMSINI
jgi:RimJ/RimL family protein N-acetyltransferase